MSGSDVLRRQRAVWQDLARRDNKTLRAPVGLSSGTLYTWKLYRRSHWKNAWLCCGNGGYACNDLIGPLSWSDQGVCSGLSASPPWKTPGGPARKGRLCYFLESEGLMTKQPGAA
jgi:hypothetical protein